MMAPRNSSSSDTPDKHATRAMSNQFRGVRICLLERSVACLRHAVGARAAVELQLREEGLQWSCC